MNKKLISILGFLVTVGAVGLALYVGGFLGTMTMAVTAGTQPEEVVCSKTITITDTNPVLTYCTYQNDDGSIDLQFNCDMSGVSSTDPKCNFEQWEDYTVEIGIDNADFTNCQTTPTKTIASGAHNITIKTTGNIARCPLTGTMLVEGTLTS